MIDKIVRYWHRSTSALRLIFIRHRTPILAAGFFLVITSLLTWPFIIHPFSTQVGANYGDIFASIAQFDAIKNDGNNPFIDGRIESIAYPDSVRSNIGVDRVSFLSTSFLWLLTLAFSSTFAHNMYIFLGYFISAFVMFLFIRKYTKSSVLGILAGLAFITFPLFISLAQAAPVYMWTWLYILPIWATIELAKNYSKKQLLLTAASIIPGVFWTPYFMLHLFLILFACSIVYTAIYFKNHRKLPYKSLSIIATVVVIVAGFYAAIGYSERRATVIPERPISDAYDQSLHPLMLLTPTSYTAIATPIYDTVIKPIRPRGADTVLFAGYTVFVLALIGVFAVFRSKLLTKDMRVLGLFAVAVSVIALAFSLAPTITIFDMRIPTPNFLVVHFVPALRAGQRLVAPIMLGLIILAILGIYYLSHRFRSHVRPPILIACTVALVAIEYTTAFSQMTVPMYPAPSMQQLAIAPKGIVAEYFNNSIIGYPGQLACKNYLVHHQTMVNPCSLAIYTEPGKYPIIEAINKLSMQEQVKELQRIGVTYFIVDGTSPVAEAQLLENGYRIYLHDSKFRIYTLN